MSFTNKQILVTGGGKGIGESLTLKLLTSGAKVITIIKSKIDNKKFKKFKNIKIYNGDVNNHLLIKKIFSDADKKKIVITGLVNNAGVRFRKDFITISKKDLTKVMNTNFLSIFFIMQEFSKHILKNKKKGAIVNIGSIVGQYGFEQLAAYAASKGALTSLTQSFSTEMSKKGIRANVISPGFTKSSFYKNFKKNKKNLYKWTLNKTALGRWGETNEISNLILFLLSEKSSYITGENIKIDGGWRI